MSRCLPFPPPSYETARTYHDARIQSMKLLKEKEIAKKDGKKQKRQEEKRKAEKGIEVENEKHGHKRRHKDERCQEDKKRRSNKKMEGSDAQQLDKSSLSEEYRHPITFENPSDSTESTQNSSKRQKQSSSPEGVHNAGELMPLIQNFDCCCYFTGSLIRIRIPLLQNKNLSQSSEINAFTPRQARSVFGVDSSIQELCETSLRANTGRENSDSSTSLVFNHEVAFEHGIHTTSEAVEANTKVHKYDPLPLDLEIRNLLNVVDLPSVHLVDLDEADQEWLYEGNSQRALKDKACSYEVRFEGRNMWPKGCYLPDADVYALPFSVPF